MERYSWKIRRLRDWAERCRAQVRMRSLWPVLTFFQSFTAVTASSMLVIWLSGITRGRLTTSKSLSWQFWPKRQNLSFAVSGEEVSRSETEHYTPLISLLIRDIAIPWFFCFCLFLSDDPCVKDPCSDGTRCQTIDERYDCICPEITTSTAECGRSM